MLPNTIDWTFTAVPQALGDVVHATIETWRASRSYPSWRRTAPTAPHNWACGSWGKGLVRRSARTAALVVGHPTRPASPRRSAPCRRKTPQRVLLVSSRNLLETCGGRGPSTTLAYIWMRSGDSCSKAKRRSPASLASPSTVSSFEPRLSNRVHHARHRTPWAPERTGDQQGIGPPSPKRLPGPGLSHQGQAPRAHLRPSARPDRIGRLAVVVVAGLRVIGEARRHRQAQLGTSSASVRALAAQERPSSRARPLGRRRRRSRETQRIPAIHLAGHLARSPPPGPIDGRRRRRPGRTQGRLSRLIGHLGIDQHLCPKKASTGARQGGQSGHGAALEVLVRQGPSPTVCDAAPRQVIKRPASSAARFCRNRGWPARQAALLGPPAVEGCLAARLVAGQEFGGRPGGRQEPVQGLDAARNDRHQVVVLRGAKDGVDQGSLPAGPLRAAAPSAGRRGNASTFLGHPRRRRGRRRSPRPSGAIGPMAPRSKLDLHVRPAPSFTT